MAVLTEHMGLSINQGENNPATVLIPVGRCISRYDAAPDFFRYPRVVLSTNLENQGGWSGNSIFLKDRLFIGFQGRTAKMEVISYNDLAGRFEFQTVSKYDGGGAPVVEYARREQCIACHQNEGPIFPQVPWDETNHNEAVYDMLSESLQSPDSSVPAYTGSGATELNSSTNRANLISLFQAFWKGTCQAESDWAATRCRAGLFEMVMLNRFHGRNRIFPLSERIRNYLIPYSISNIEEIWPQGISLVNSDVLNENPIENGISAHLELAENLKRSRPAAIRWDPDNVQRMIAGLGDLVPLEDMRKLDSVLHQHAIQKQRDRSRISGNCSLRLSSRTETPKGAFDVSAEVSAECTFVRGGFSGNYHLVFDLIVDSGNIYKMPIFSRMMLDVRSEILGMTHNGGKLVSEGNDWVARLDLLDARHRFHARVPGGGMVDQIEIRWPKQYSSPQPVGRNTMVSGTVSLEIVSDYDALDRGIKDLVLGTISGRQDFFTNRPFRGRDMVRALVDSIQSM